tara:strand:+ start:609 stop:1229 length:621 start_codon:yes stop_codon:yes gene_type:complete
MIEIHHVPATRGVRPIWLCEELGLDYEIHPVDFSAEYRASKEWRAMNPVGKVPVMIDTNADNLTMFESGAMVQYLLDRYGNGLLQPPPGTPEHAKYLQWSWFAEATFARPLGEIVNHFREFPGEETKEDVVEEMRNRARLSLDAITQSVVNVDYILGDHFSAADIMLGYTIMLCEKYLKEQLPEKIRPYWERLETRPGYRVAMDIH